MTEGEVSTEGKKGGEEEGRSGPRMGGRFRAPTSSAVDGPAYIPDDEDQAVESVAKRFRAGPRLGTPVVEDTPSLDEEDFDAGALDGDSLLAALDGPPKETIEEETAAVLPNTEQRDEKIPEVNVEPITEKKVEARKNPLVCPSCRAESPAGMRFCVECGGTLQAKKSDQSDERAKVIAPAGAKQKSAPPPTEAAQKESPWNLSLVAINEDGSDGKLIPLEYLETTMGRDGDERFPTDAFLSPKHARFHIEDGDLFVEDLYSLNGTFIKLREETRLAPGDTILMGRQVLRFERFEQSITPKTKSSDGTRYMGSPAPGGDFKVLQIGIGGVVQNVYCLPQTGAVLGREKGDIVFPHDKFMSGRHAQIYTGDDDHCYLVDLNSSNGTWIKIWEKTRLEDGDFMFMGQQLFRVKFED